MFLHSGASLHGHEYSNRPAPGAGQVLNRRSPLLRSPFAAPLARSNTAPPSAPQSRYPPPQPACPAQTAQPRQQPLQSCLPQKPSSRLRWSTTEEPVVRFQEPLEVADGVSEKHDSVLGPPSPAIVSEDEGSCSEASEVGSAQGTGRRRRRHRPRLPRKSSVFFLAKPAPKLVKKRLMKQPVRPKLLLQLHHLSVDKRPTPLLDIFPASTIAGPALGGRFAKRFPRVFGVTGDRNELGSQDVVLLRSEEYCTTADCQEGPVPDDDDEEEGDNLNRRELVAILSPLRREDRTEIVLDNGSVWVAAPLANGSFEFTHTDAHGVNTTARWVRRSQVKVTAPAPTAPAANVHPCPDNSSPWATSVDEYKYTFSIIDPLSRRHPIMATLTKNTLDVLENYTTVSSSYGKYPPSRSFGNSHSHGASSDEDDDDEDGGAPLPKPERQSKPVDAATRNIISITAVWVTLRLGGIMPASTERTMSLRSGAASRARNGSISGGPKSPVNGSSATSSAAAGREDTATSGSQAPSMGGGGGASLLPRRATSTGAAFMQRRMQTSDASDSERAVAGAPLSSSGLRSKSRRVLSGDWNVSWKRGSTPQPTTATAAAAHIVGMSPVPPPSREPQSSRRDHHQSSTWPISSFSGGGGGGASLLSGSSRPGSAQPVPETRSDRRAQSALYGAPSPAAFEAVGLIGQQRSHATASPALVDPNGPAGALAALEGGIDASAAAGGPHGADNAVRADKGWKRVSGWIRRFGR